MMVGPTGIRLPPGPPPGRPPALPPGIRLPPGPPPGNVMNSRISRLIIYFAKHRNEKTH